MLQLHSGKIHLGKITLFPHDDFTFHFPRKFGGGVVINRSGLYINAMLVVDDVSTLATKHQLLLKVGGRHGRDALFSGRKLRRRQQRRDVRPLNF